MVTYRGLGFDPTPGSVDAVAQTVTRLRAAVDALSSVDDAVAEAGRHSATWQGAAADAFRARLNASPVPTGHLRAALPVLERWAATLAANKRRTEELDAAALRLRRALDDARDALQDKQNALDLAATPAAAAVASVEVTAAAGRVTEAEAALDAVLSEARELARAHERAANEAADALDPGTAPERTVRPAIRALAGVLNRSSRVSAAVAGLVAPAPPHESPIRAPGGPPISTLPAGTDSSEPGGPDTGKNPPTNPSESPFGAPGGPPISTLPGSTDSSGRPAVAAFAAAVAGTPRGTGELIVLGEARLPVSES